MKTSEAPRAKPRKATKKKSWGKRISLAVLLTVLTGIIAVCVAFLVAYSRIDIPSPDEFALAESSTVYYADGTSEMGTFAEVDRTIIDASTLPAYVGNAIVASEDRTFYSNSGIDLKGIFRALINNVTGGQRQGASTISQGYVENYYLGSNKDKTYLRKLEEAILALKVNRESDKAQILGNYMNTIYFGRSAYGIEAAAEAYFGKPAAELTLSEAAMLAGILPAPSAWDPAVSPDKAYERWQRVLDLMVEDGWASPSEVAEAKFPKTIDPGRAASGNAGPDAYLLQQVYDELIIRSDLTAQDIDAGGVTITTTIDKAMQEAAANSVKAMPEDTPDNVRVALSAVDNATGAILAEYPGSDYEQNQMNAVTQDRAMAGSTFKPFGLLAFIEDGGSLSEYFNGNSPQEFSGMRVANNANVSFGTIDLITATMYSVNTVFVALNEEVGPAATLDAMERAGIPKDTPGLEPTLGNILGYASPHNIDLAAAYATFATGGLRVTPHIVDTVVDRHGVEVYRGAVEPEEAFDVETISSVMPALEAVTSERGTGAKVASIKHPVAGKTGTSEEQRSAQFVGFIPQMTTAVSMYAVGEDGGSEPLPNIGGLDQFHGSDWPTDVWAAFMIPATENMPVEDFKWLDDVEVQEAPVYQPPTEPEAPVVPEEKPEPELPAVEPDQPEPGGTEPGGSDPNPPPTGGGEGGTGGGGTPGGTPGGGPGGGPETTDPPPDPGVDDNG